MSRGPIVAGTDGSTRANVAVDKAAELAQALGAEVHVVCAPEHLEGQDWPPRITAQQIVADAEERLRNHGITVQTHIPTGDAALALGTVAEQQQAQMIVVGNRGMTGIRRVLGSLPNTVSHEALCDVLIVPTQARELAEFGGRPVVVGADGSGDDARTLEEAIRLAKALGGELHVVSISKSADAPEAALAMQATEQGVRAQAHALDGDPARTILGVAERHDAAIIVIASKGMRGDGPPWVGNVADKVSHDGRVSVLIVSGGASGAMTGTGAAASGEVHAGS